MSNTFLAWNISVHFVIIITYNNIRRSIAQAAIDLDGRQLNESPVDHARSSPPPVVRRYNRRSQRRDPQKRKTTTDLRYTNV